MTDTVGGSDPDPDIDADFAKLLRDMEAGRPARVHEPSARVRMLQSMWREFPPPTTPWRGEWPAFGDAAAEADDARRGGYRRRRAALRVWPRRTAIAVIICALAFAVVETTRTRSRNAAAKPAVNVAVNAHQPTPTSTARPAGDATLLAADDVIPLTRLFPGTVPAANGGAYTLLQSGDLADCIKSDLVGAKLAGLFAQSNGCVAGEEALYKDEANDQFNVVVFTLKDPADTLRIMNELAMDDTDFEVAPQVPPDGSGLADLSADNDIVQLFASDGDRMAVFMAQWADGRVSDDEDLERLLTPLQDAIGRSLSAGESGSR